MDRPNRLTLLIRALRSPTSKPPVNIELDQRLDAIDQRLDLLQAEYRRGDVALKRR